MEDISILDFNPLPRKEGDLCCIMEDISILDFNPLPRKEGDTQNNSPTYFLKILVRTMLLLSFSLLPPSGLRAFRAW